MGLFIEYRTQAHEMWMEGTSDKEPNLDAIREDGRRMGFDLDDLHAWYDTMQEFWRFGANLRPQPTTNDETRG